MSTEGHTHEYHIIVNGTEHGVTGYEISYEQLLVLAFGASVPSGDGVAITVTYSLGHDDKKSGSLTAGESVKVKDGMVFNVTATNRS